MEKHFEVKLVIFPKLYLADKPHLIKDYQEDIVGRIINWSGLSRMTNEMMVRRAKSAKIGKTLTAYLILGADGGEGGGGALSEPNWGLSTPYNRIDKFRMSNTIPIIISYFLVGQ